jgi:NADP-dependent 3-hydroxy acid dehydrogenase YdfG
MKAAVVTGTSSGLGLAIAKSLLLQGWKVFGLSRTATPEALKGFSEYHHKFLNITNQIDVQDFFESLPLYGVKSLSLLVNNAGVFRNKDFQYQNAYDITEVIDTNVKGTMFVTQSAIHFMELNSRIIFINSVAGLNELRGQAIYCASKAALTAFAGVLGNELRKEHIKVTSIHPGGINTPLWNESNPYPPSPEDSSQAMDPKEITDMIQFILSSDVEFKTIKLFPSIEWH